MDVCIDLDNEILFFSLSLCLRIKRCFEIGFVMQDFDIGDFNCFQFIVVL